MNKRTFNGSDVYLISTSSVLQGLFEKDLAVFTAFDPSLNATFAANWMAAINDCASRYTDFNIRANISGYVEESRMAMDQCREKFQDVKYFMKKAFPKQPAIHEEFGTKRYGMAQRTQGRMILFMDELHAVCEKYKTQLAAVGFLQPQIDEIVTLKNDLAAKNLAQESYKNGRPVLSAERVEKLNNLYSYAAQVCAAAQRIYRNTSYAKRKQFVYEPVQKTVYHESIEPNSYNMVAETIRVSRKFSIENKGTVTLQFGFSNNAEIITTNRITVAPGKKVVVAKKDFQPPEGNFLVAYNMNDTAGEYRVKG